MNRIIVYTILVCALAAWTMTLRGLKRAGSRESAPALSVSARASSSVADPAFTEIKGHEGYWRIARSRDGVWWFLSPQNKTEFLNGVTTVQPVLRGRDPRGPDFISHDLDPRTGKTGLALWATATLRRVEHVGFKSLGAWCNPIFHDLDVPMTRDLNVCQWAPFRARLFGPEWQAAADLAIRAQASSLRHNHNLAGYYTDNELDWSDFEIGPRACFDQLPPSDPNRREVLGVIHGLWPDIASFNREWNTRFADWADLERHPMLPKGTSAGYEKLDQQWLSHYAEAYFRLTAQIIRRYDPNHLILGCRYRGWAPARVARAARQYTDAQSINYYSGDALLDEQVFTTIVSESHQPLIVSEYSFHALDGRSGDRNTVHFPALVKDQQARAEGYRAMTVRLARVPYVIGADWFQWMDEPPSGRLGDGEDANFGIVDIHDRAYDPLAEAVTQTTPLLDNLHAGSAASPTETVWRTSPAAPKPPVQLAGGASELTDK